MRATEILVEFPQTNIRVASFCKTDRIEFVEIVLRTTLGSFPNDSKVRQELSGNTFTAQLPAIKSALFRDKLNFGGKIRNTQQPSAICQHRENTANGA